MSLARPVAAVAPGTRGLSAVAAAFFGQRAPYGTCLPTHLPSTGGEAELLSFRPGRHGIAREMAKATFDREFAGLAERAGR